MATETLTANGSTAALQFQGEGSVNVADDLGSGTLTIEASFDGGTTWIAQTDGAFTAVGTLNIKIGPCSIRTTLTGSTSPNAIVSIVGNDVRKSSRLD